MPNIRTNFIPDSRDMLALNGITSYDVNAFIYDKKSELPIPQTKPDLKNDKFDQTDKKTKGWKTFGNVFLGVLAIGGTALIFRKKLPKLIQNLGENAKKLFKKS